MLSIDYGTKTCPVGYRVLSPNDTAIANNVRDILFDRGEYEAPQRVAWAEDGTFLWGQVSVGGHDALLSRH